MRETRALRTLLAWVVVLALGGCGASPAALPGAPPAGLDTGGVTPLRVTVLGTTPHDPTAFTQGFELADRAGGTALWEGTGRTGSSQLRELDPTTGALRRAVDLPPEVFGEGITVLPDRIWQLTWRDGVVYDRDPSTLAVRRSLPLDREGWGICHRDGALVTSDGTDELVVRDPVTFAPRTTVQVRAAGVPVDRLNELECTADGVWANVWTTDRIVRIDAATGRVTAVVDAAGLLPPEQRGGADVLNGIAAVPGTDEYLLTGKLWPTTFRVRFTPLPP